eukprot:8274502-Pyramimonas_sp.AAC.1
MEDWLRHGNVGRDVLERRVDGGCNAHEAGVVHLGVVGADGWHERVVDQPLDHGFGNHRRRQQRPESANRGLAYFERGTFSGPWQRNATQPLDELVIQRVSADDLP